MRLTSTEIMPMATKCLIPFVSFGTSILTRTGILYSGVKYARVESKEHGKFGALHSCGGVTSYLFCLYFTCRFTTAYTPLTQ